MTAVETAAGTHGSLSGLRVWITGASRGLGAAIATSFADSGARIAVTARSEEPLRELAERQARAGREVMVLPGSVTDTSTVEEMAQKMDSEWGGLDVLINGAGISPTFKRADELTDTEWESVVDVNLNGTFFCSRAAARLMGEGGSIINITSIHARVGMGRLAAYSASKGGIEALTRTLALEWADRGIRVNSLCPGYFATEMTEGLRGHDRWRDVLLGRIPLGRFGEPEDLVPAAVFLATDASRYVTGSCLTVDGGWTAG
jgi:NAD(P)-dependent dehydrogenase (short-subunit alcohol dehydrogenase family)